MQCRDTNSVAVADNLGPDQMPLCGLSGREFFYLGHNPPPGVCVPDFMASGLGTLTPPTKLVRSGSLKARSRMARSPHVAFVLLVTRSDGISRDELHFTSFSKAIPASACLSSLNSEAHFWLPQKKKLIRNAISLLLLADEPVRLRTLYDMTLAAPNNQDDVSTTTWQASSTLFHAPESPTQPAWPPL
jgi:hypothetical protein